MTQIIAQSVGIDISKDTLDIHLHPAGIAKRLANDAKGIKSLLAWLCEFPVVRIVFEPTGPYHHALERQLGEGASPREDQSTPGATLCRSDRSPGQD